MSSLILFSLCLSLSLSRAARAAVGFPVWRRPPCAGRPSPRQAMLRIRVGLPTQEKHQKVSYAVARQCSFPSTRSSCNQPATSRRCRTKTLKLDPSTRQSHLHRSNHTKDQSSTNHMGTTKLHQQRRQVPSTNHLETVLLAPRQLTTYKKGEGHTSRDIAELTSSADTMTSRCQPQPSRMTWQPHADALVVDAASGQQHSRQRTNANAQPAPSAVNSSVTVKHCKSGATATDHELHPKQPKD